MTPIMVSQSLTGFKFLSRHGFYASRQCDIDRNPTDPKINRGHGAWPTNTLMLVSLSLIGFKRWADTDFMLQVSVTLIFYLLSPKSIGIICRSWQTKTLNMVSLSFIGLKLLNRQGFYVAGQCDFDLFTTDPNINRNLSSLTSWRHNTAPDPVRAWSI